MVWDLASEGTVGIDPGVAPRNQPEIDDGDETVLEELHQMVYYEICTVRAQSLVVKRHRHSLIRTKYTHTWVLK